ncbi:uncharacterized protein CLUP02_10520 [Colletotrichum lupini]|uniref:Uncharacterized protein n=1 Tax=Colletotrichum lupini TaxID=145971 RepID=A0A9Q8SWW4_9PEZI|nr:uncharacterized protein CLUP02_10520 [Colletotrichum lupini]KAK1715953.1 hypothetical protein BDP67DRAFT_511581 [Colletotrichum lupini]UQC85024.1 hypothetical protein CLUP02_10520 [Colletotrichum lupini]
MDTLLICSLLYLCSVTIVPARLLYSTSLPISFFSLHPISLTRVSTCPLPRTNTHTFVSFRFADTYFSSTTTKELPKDKKKSTTALHG